MGHKPRTLAATSGHFQALNPAGYQGKVSGQPRPGREAQRSGSAPASKWQCQASWLTLEWPRTRSADVS